MRPVDKLYKTISRAQTKLDAIRAKCKHLKTRRGNYMPRIGMILTMDLCVRCDKPIPGPFPTAQGQASGMTLGLGQ